MDGSISTAISAGMESLGLDGHHLARTRTGQAIGCSACASRRPDALATTKGRQRPMAVGPTRLKVLVNFEPSFREASERQVDIQTAAIPGIYTLFFCMLFRMQIQVMHSSFPMPAFGRSCQRLAWPASGRLNSLFAPIVNIDVHCDASNFALLCFANSFFPQRRPCKCVVLARWVMSSFRSACEKKSFVILILSGAGGSR